LKGDNMHRWSVLEKLINENKYKVIAEIGVAHGATAKHLLTNCDIDLYYMVDPVVDNELMEWLIDNKVSMQFDCDYIIKTSTDAMPFIADHSLDLAFIDALHDEKNVRNDCQLIIPKVRAGGIISGHDYEHRRHKGVKPAVDSVFGAENLNLVPVSAGKLWWLYI